MLARALATNPKVLLCDEATSALDPTTTNSILELIRSINEKLGITVIIITHQMSVVESICKHVAILDNGVIVEQGAVSEVFAHPKSRAAQSLVFPEGNSGPAVLSESGDRITALFLTVLLRQESLLSQEWLCKKELKPISPMRLPRALTERFTEVCFLVLQVMMIR